MQLYIYIYICIHIHVCNSMYLHTGKLKRNPSIDPSSMIQGNFCRLHGWRLRSLEITNRNYCFEGNQPALPCLIALNGESQSLHKKICSDRLNCENRIHKNKRKRIPNDGWGCGLCKWCTCLCCSLSKWRFNASFGGRWSKYMHDLRTLQFIYR